MTKSAMKPVSLDNLPNVSFDDQHPGLGDASRELLLGLSQQQKTVNPKFFYDERGSRLFDQITRLPEYYPTRSELAILQQYREQIAQYCGAGCVIIEPGSGSSEKVRLLLDALKPAAYVPLDISADFLQQAAMRLGGEFADTQIHAICADFAHNWSLPGDLPEGKRVVFYPGSTIGNLEPQDALGFLKRMRQWVADDGGLLIGVDLHKSPERLNAAYNDAAGITADFNLNLLANLNTILDSDFRAQQFAHRAFYDEDQQRIEMHLVSLQDQQVRCQGRCFEFQQGETIHTECSYKYTVAGFTEMAAAAGFALQRSWFDDDQLFSVHYLSPS